MFPLSDSTQKRTIPFINYLIIAANIYVFYLQLTVPDPDTFIYQYAFVPSQFSITNPTTYIYIFYSMFMHGGFFHIISNLWFLRIFGDNIEDELGHLPYLLFYLAAGVIATLVQYAIAVDSMIPIIGASGAISGVAGAYFVFHNRATVRTLITLFIFWQVIDLPVTLFLGYWFFIQLFNGVGSLVSNYNEGGVAFMAHVGGFVFGYIIAKTLGRPNRGEA